MVNGFLYRSGTQSTLHSPIHTQEQLGAHYLQEHFNTFMGGARIEPAILGYLTATLTTELFHPMVG